MRLQDNGGRIYGKSKKIKKSDCCTLQQSDFLYIYSEHNYDYAISDIIMLSMALYSSSVRS